MSKVSRSIYQKAIEENRRLVADIKLLVNKNESMDQQNCIVKWRSEFENQDEFNRMMKLFAEQYIKDHKHELPGFLTNPNQ